MTQRKTLSKYALFKKKAKRPIGSIFVCVKQAQGLLFCGMDEMLFQMNLK
jgi:hypothetical protein